MPIDTTEPPTISFPWWTGWRDDGREGVLRCMWCEAAETFTLSAPDFVDALRARVAHHALCTEPVRRVVEVKE